MMNIRFVEYLTVDCSSCIYFLDEIMQKSINVYDVMTIQYVQYLNNFTRVKTNLDKFECSDIHKIIKTKS